MYGVVRVFVNVNVCVKLIRRKENILSLLNIMVQQEHNVKRMVQIHLSGPSLENLICILMTNRII